VRVLKKSDEQVKEIEILGGKGFGGFIFLHNTKSFSFGGTKKLYWRSVLESLGGFI